MASSARPPTRRGVRGIPLVEIIVVVGVVGVIAAVAAPHLLAQERRGVDVSIKADLRALAQQLQGAALEGETLAVAFAAPTLTIGAERVTLAPGNTPRVFRKRAGGFCVAITNPGGTDPARGLVWRSDSGGLQGAGRTCAGYPTVVL